MQQRRPVSNTLTQRNENVGFVLLASALLGGLVAWAHWPVLSVQARCFDDSQFVTSNRLVQNPGWKSARRVITEVLKPSTVRGYYLPLTMISLMTDWAMGGRSDDLTVFHRTNLAIHTLNTIMLVLILHMLFGMTWPALFAAALFGFHPLVVEPIAWVSERKTLLAACFSFACILTYVLFTRRRRRAWFWVSFVFYFLAMLSKPTAVPLPLVLVLLDYWPLHRSEKGALLEKVPLFLLALGFGIITFVSHQRSSGFLETTALDAAKIPLVMCYLLLFYCSKMIWPSNLSPVYPLPEPLSLSNPIILVNLAVGVILVCLLLASARKTRAPLVGFLIFFVILLPTLGLVKYSWVTASDKYLYLPFVGVLLLLTWGISAAWRHRSGALRVVVGAAAFLAISAEAVASRAYLTRWKDSETLYNYILSQAPDSAEAHNNLGIALGDLHRLEESVQQFHKAIKFKYSFQPAHFNLGKALVLLQRFDEALEELRTAVKLDPNDAAALDYLGYASLLLGRIDEAETALKGALERSPYNPDTLYNYGTLLVKRGNCREAVDQFRRAIQFDSANLQPYKALAWILATHPDPSLRNGAEAVNFAEQADALTQHRDAGVLDALAAAYAEAGVFDRAVQVGQRAMEIAESDGSQDRAAQIHQRVALYQRKNQFRDASLAGSAAGK